MIFVTVVLKIENSRPEVQGLLFSYNMRTKMKKMKRLLLILYYRRFITKKSNKLFQKY